MKASSASSRSGRVFAALMSSPRAARISLAIESALFILALPSVGACRRVRESEPGAYRSFVHGGSTVAGFPVDEFSFAQQLRFRLGQLAPGRAVQRRAGGPR